MSVVKRENLAEINFHYLTHLKVFARLIFTIHFYVITKVNILEVLIFTDLPHQRK